MKDISHVHIQTPYKPLSLFGENNRLQRLNYVA